jgi:hypothetical protein
MKKLLIISLLAIVGCSDVSNVEKKKTTYVIKDYENTVEIAVIDSCEYLYGPWGNATVLTHKGNCKHCKKD